MGKGQANIVGYVLTILFSVVVLIGVTTLIYGFYSSIIRADVEKGLNEISVQIAESILKLYKYGKEFKAQPSNFSSILINEIDLNLPSQVSRRNYEVFLVSANPIWVSIKNFTVDGQNISTITKTSGAKVVAKTTQSPFVTVEYEIPNIDVSLQGRIINGVESKLRYYRYNFNNTLYDKIILGGSDILIDVTSIN